MSPVKTDKTQSTETTETQKPNTVTLNGMVLMPGLFAKTKPGLETLVNLLSANGVKDLTQITETAKALYPKDHDWVIETLGKVDDSAKALLLSAQLSAARSDLETFNTEHSAQIDKILKDIETRDALTASIDSDIDALKSEAVKVIDLDLDKLFDLTFVPSSKGFYVDKVKKTQTRTAVDYDYLSAPHWTYQGYKGLDSADNKYNADLRPDPKATGDSAAQSDGSGSWLCDVTLINTGKTYSAQSADSAHSAYSAAVIMARKDLGIKDPEDWTVNTPQTFGVFTKDQSAQIDSAQSAQSADSDS